jgi:predicted ATP-grasp superfamily ATP-dependent carboligase
MQAPSLPVLIVAQSARYLAQSATQAGYPVWVADCFGDIDTQAAAERWQKLPALSELDTPYLLNLITTFANGQECNLICGSGIEVFYPILEQLPENIHYLGNSRNSIEQIKNPSLFFSLLSRHNLPYPATQFEQPEKNDFWLFKESAGLGGTHICSAGKSPKNKSGYFQQKILGDSASLLFIANAKKAQPISINQQQIKNKEPKPFQLSAIETPFALSEPHRRLLFNAINIITQETGLVGLNSLDFIIDENQQLFILEINPRPSASSELVNHNKLFHCHLQACQGKYSFEIPIKINNDHCGIYYLYAPQTLIVPRNIKWPIHSHDLPQPGTIIEANQPICTIVIIDSDIERCRQKQQLISAQILDQLTTKP